MLQYKIRNFKNLIKSKIISDKAFTQKKFYKKFGKQLNFDDPQSFNEKINVMLTSEETYKLAPYVDKYLVRDFVEKTIGKEYLIDLIYYGDKLDKELFDKLPEKFIFKSVTGAGMNYICHQKKPADYKKINKKLGKWLNLNFYLRTREKQYRYIQPKFIVENLLVSSDGLVPIDYKFHCFNGKIEFITAVTSRFKKDSKITVFDKNGDALPVDYIKTRDEEYKKIDINLDEFRPVVEKLAKKFKFVRVDLYYFQNQIKFGELTFTPMNGTGRFDPMSYDYEFGKLIDISKDISFFA